MIVFYSYWCTWLFSGIFCKKKKDQLSNINHPRDGANGSKKQHCTSQMQAFYCTINLPG